MNPARESKKVNTRHAKTFSEQMFFRTNVMNHIEAQKFENHEFLEQHIQSTLDFYSPRVVSPEGGFYGGFTLSLIHI